MLPGSGRLGKAKKLDAIHKRQRIPVDERPQPQDQPSDCQLCSCQLVWKTDGYSKPGEIKIEAGRNLHSWAFYQLKEMIRYKVEIVGVRFKEVKAEYTSQTC
jgi:transposase